MNWEQIESKWEQLMGSAKAARKHQMTPLNHSGRAA